MRPAALLSVLIVGALTVRMSEAIVAVNLCKSNQNDLYAMSNDDVNAQTLTYNGNVRYRRDAVR